jgi:hypothetical protein
VGRGGEPGRGLPLLLSALILAALPARAGPEGGAPPGLAVLPLQNRSDAAAPVDRIQADLTAQLVWQGVSVLVPEDLEAFMRRHRMRYVGGINGELARALAEETGVRAVLITSLDLYAERIPPKAALTARLVSTGEEPRILWAGSASASGDAAPGFLGLGLMDDIETILGRTVRAIGTAAARQAEVPGEPAVEADGADRRPARRFRPKVHFSAPSIPVLGAEGARIAVLPLSNASTMPYAGEIVTDLVIEGLTQAGFQVIEPGVVRQTLLESRLIQPQGPSVPQAGILDAELDLDRLIFGEVTTYQEAGAGSLYPVVDFDVRVMDVPTRQVVWASISHTRGNEDVFFFDVGRVPTAHELTSRMVAALVSLFRDSAEAMEAIRDDVGVSIAEDNF